MSALVRPETVHAETPRRPASGRPRIAIVAPRPGRPGGQEVQASLLATHLMDEGYEVTRLPIDPRFPGGLAWARRVPVARTLLNQAIYLPSLARLRRAEVVHVFSASYWSFLLAPLPAILAARLLRRRVVLHYHSGEAEDHLARWGNLVHPWLRMADAIAVPSEYLRDVFARHGYRTSVIPNVTDLSRFRFRERSPLQPRFLSTRALEAYYRVDVTLRAFALIRARRPDATLTIAGAGREEKRLKELARRLGIDGVGFLGAVGRDRMGALYDAHDILLNASVLDNQPVSVIEAFASGLPVVSTATGDLAAMVRDRVTGLVVPPNHPWAMAAAGLNLLCQPNRARLLARRARQEAEARAWASVRDLWAELYDGGGR